MILPAWLPIIPYSHYFQADQGDPQPMGDPNKELSEDDFDKFDAKRSEAMSVFSEGEWEKAIPIFTEAIEINATSGE